jgi:AcrR family transcriptional regulator
MKGGTAQRRVEIGRDRRNRSIQKLLESAARVVADRGSSRATIDDFIAAAGLSRGTFYNHFQTREALLDALWAHLGHAPFVEIQRACDQIADPALRLVTEARLVVQKSAENPTWGWLVLAASSDGETVNPELLSFPRPDLALGQRMGRFTFDNLEVAGDLVVLAVRQAMRVSLTGHGASDGYAASVCLMLLRALGISEAEAKDLVASPLPTFPQPLFGLAQTSAAG